MRENPIEHLAILFVAIESVIEERPQEAPALGSAERIGTLHEVRLIAQNSDAVAAVLQKSDNVAYGSGAESDQHRILRGINQLVNFSRLKSGGHHQARAVLDFPIAARNGSTRAIDAIAHGERELGVVRICRRVREVVAIG